MAHIRSAARLTFPRHSWGMHATKARAAAHAWPYTYTIEKALSCCMPRLQKLEITSSYSCRQHCLHWRLLPTGGTQGCWLWV